MSGAHRDDAVVLLRIEGIEPQPVPVGGILEIADGPAFLEPLIDEREQSGARRARCVDLARESRVDLGLLRLRMAAVVPALRLNVTDSAR